MQWAVLLLAAAARLRAPCNCGALLQGASQGPDCACLGGGIPRKVHTREELEAKSQAELDKMLRDTQDELDEDKGIEKAEAKQHEKELDELNTTTQEAVGKLDGDAAAAKEEYVDAKANYSAEGEAVKELETELREERSPIVDLTFEMEQVKEEIGSKLMVLSSCECKEGGDALLARKRLLNHTGLLAVRSALGGPERVKKIETAMDIEKLENSIVDILKATQAEQKDFDASVAALGEAEKKAEMNATQFHSEQEKSQGLLDTRAEQQAKAREALETMIAEKKAQHEAAKQHLEDAKRQLEELTKELADCGC